MISRSTTCIACLAPCAIAILAATAASAQPAAENRWMRHDEIDSVDHTNIPTVILPATSGSYGRVGGPVIPRKPILVLRCRQRELQVFVLFDKPVTGLNRSVKALFRIGDGPIQASMLPASPDGDAYGAYTTQTSRALIDAMLAATHFTMRTKSDTGETSEGDFDLTGIAAAAQPIRQACTI